MSSDFLYRFCSWEMENDPFLWLTFGSKSSCNSVSVHGQNNGVRCQSLCSHSDHLCSSRTKTDVAKFTFYVGLFFLRKFLFYWNRSFYVLWNQRWIPTHMTAVQLRRAHVLRTLWVPSAEVHGSALAVPASPVFPSAATPMVTWAGRAFCITNHGWKGSH